MPRKITHSTTLPMKPPMKKDNKQISTISLQRPSFFQTIKEGVAFGIGSSVGHRIVGNLMGNSQTESPVQNTDKKTEYDQCIKEYNDESACKRFLI